MTTATKAAEMTNAVANDFRLNTVFRLGDWAVLSVQTAWRTSYSLAVRSGDDSQVSWEGRYSTLGLLLARYSQEILADYRLAIAQDYAVDSDLDDVDRARKLIGIHDLDLIEREAGFGVVEAAHWDTIDFTDVSVLDPDEFPSGLTIIR
jgi:hypothetical protein